MSNLQDHINQVIEHCIICAKAHGETFVSAHEGFGVIHEEHDELWHEIKQKNPNYDKMYFEAMHLAQTAIKMMASIRKFKQADDRK